MNAAPTPSDDCRRARVALSARLDGELSGLGEARLAAHLRACSACAAYALEAAAIATRLRQAALERPLRPVEVRRRRGVGAAAAAAVAVAAAAAIAVGTIQPPPAPTSPQAEAPAVRRIQAQQRLVATLTSLNVPVPKERHGRVIPV